MEDSLNLAATSTLTIFFPGIGVPWRASKREAGSGIATGAEKTPARATA